MYPGGGGGEVVEYNTVSMISDHIFSKHPQARISFEAKIYAKWGFHITFPEFTP